eukprot:CAMPEP_0170506100 /NCGR_PEP_ID=MMETSP0208-20121228/53600_1 /TAXON_ID=197538 /ORGANISM="Strombidium inclinatum, Strain S3" /LENGTH=136 /DNA_ID=CAMNT_0010787401 /DNA_START=170 /DNA_END=577 /DNA_ORIENTATION=-
MAEARAIVNFISRKCGLDDWANADAVYRGEILLEFFEKDFFWKSVRVPLYYSDDDPKRPEMMKNIFEVAFPHFLNHFNRRLSLFKDKFICSDKVSSFDLFVGGFLLNVALNPNAHFADQWKASYEQHTTDRVKQYV